MRYKIKQTILLLVYSLGFLLLQLNLSSQLAHATVPYTATDVLGQPDFTSYDVATTATGFNAPEATALDTIHHRLFVAEINNNRVTIFNLDDNNNLIDKTADYVLGQPDFTSNSPATTQDGMGGPTGLFYDDTNDWLFVSDGWNGNNRILVFDLSGGIVNGMNASYVLGEPDFTTTILATTQDGINAPSAVSYNSVTKQLAVGDFSNSRVLIFDLAGGITNGMNASYVLGQPDFISGGWATSQNGMDGPWGVVFDNNHNRLFVDDHENSRVTVFDLSGGITNGMNASYVLGQPDFTTIDDGPTQSVMYYPNAIAYDPNADRIFITGYGDPVCTVFAYDLAGGITNGMNASGVLGGATFDDVTSCSTTQNTFFFSDYEGNMIFDATQNRLWIPDGSNSRVMIYNFAQITTTSLPNGTKGSSYNQTISTSGAQGTKSFSITSGSLPPGVMLDSSTGTLSGTPTSAGVYSFTIQISDNNGNAGNLYR